MQLLSSRVLDCMCKGPMSMKNDENEMVKLRALVCAACLLLLSIANLACRARGTMDAIAESHIEANAPEGAEFDQDLRRDLTRYLCIDASDCRVEYEYLRKGATQSGTSYPKYYLWTKCVKNGKLTSEGAVRVAAIDQSYFKVTDFLTAKEIIGSPNDIGNVFPAALVYKIRKKAQQSLESTSTGRQ